jgi:hypothetical protein
MALRDMAQHGAPGLVHRIDLNTLIARGNRTLELENVIYGRSLRRCCYAGAFDQTYSAPATRFGPRAFAGPLESARGRHCREVLRRCRVITRS